MTATTSTASQWFFCPKPKPQIPLRMFCFPYAGGGVNIFRAWPTALESLAEVHIVQLPGRDGRLREAPVTQLAHLVTKIADEMLAYLDKPFVFFGHSMGAILSFEVARRLRRERGVEPLQMFVSGRPAPQVARREPVTYDLPEPEFVEELLKLNGTPREVLENVELRQLVLPILRADFAVCQTFEYLSEPPLNCPITAYGGLQDSVSHEDLSQWREQTTARFKMSMFPGDHFFLNTAQPSLLRLITKELHQYVTAH
jgi:medium-chain acyl-[acyl-carrier-protein] hydrolase